MARNPVGHGRETPRQRPWVFRLPAWVRDAGLDCNAPLLDDASRMAFVLGLTRRNIDTRTGGPFGAAVFDGSGHVVAVGVNLVVRWACSVWHAEIVALVGAQRRLGRYDLSAGGREHCELVTSSEPCAMCFGAIAWSGIARLVCGARALDARRVGFDEGDKPRHWVASLRHRGIKVTRDVCRAEARRLLRDYAARGGTIYNPGRAP
ncbi:MAG: nucleoside deaminase [Lentisphaeria bacterium]|nr:nucleoside deaminase [Lentisphaeria bacterium]